MFNSAYNKFHGYDQSNNPYAGLLGAIGTIMGQNARQRNETGIVNALSPIVNGQTDQTPQGGLLSGNGIPDINFAPQYAPQQQLTPNGSSQSQGLLGSTAFDYQPQSQVQPQATQQPTNDTKPPVDTNTPTTDPTAAENATTTTDATPTPATVPSPTPAETKQTPLYMSAPSKSDIAKQYNKMGATAIQELVTKRGMSAKDAIATVKDAINKRTEEDFNTAANAYSDKLHSQLDDVSGMDFSTNANKAKGMAKIMQLNYGLQKIGRPGLDMATIKDLMSVNDLKIDKIDTGDGIQYYGHSSDGTRVVPLGEKIAKQLSPGEVQQGELTREGHAITMRGQDLSHDTAMAGIAARNVNTGGLSPTAKANMFKWASAFTLQPTGEVDVMGKPIMTRVQNNPQLAAQLAGELGYGGGQQQGEDPRIAAARAAGYTDEEIQKFINGGMNTQGSLPSQFIPNYTGNEYLFGGG